MSVQHLSISPELAQARIKEAEARIKEAEASERAEVEPHKERTKQVRTVAAAAVLVILGGLIAIVEAPDAERAKYVWYTVGVLGTLFVGVWGVQRALERRRKLPPPKK